MIIVNDVKIVVMGEIIAVMVVLNVVLFFFLMLFRIGFKLNFFFFRMLDFLFSFYL